MELTCAAFDDDSLLDGAARDVADGVDAALARGGRALEH